MNKYKTCVYSTSDEKYLKYSIASLLSIREKLPDIDLFIIGRIFSDNSRSILKDKRIQLIEVDLSEQFHSCWGDYPAECYYVFYGPEQLLKMGYSHSIYIDGDVYCNRDPLAPIDGLEYIAGVTNGLCSSILQNDLEIINAKISQNHSDRMRIQTGILYFNNKKMSEINFFNKITELYKKSINLGIPRKGDDSLFALFIYLNPGLKLLELDNGYNYIEHTAAVSKLRWLTDGLRTLNKVVFYHFTDKSPKPWVNNTHTPNYASRYFSNKWARNYEPSP